MTLSPNVLASTDEHKPALLFIKWKSYLLYAKDQSTLAYFKGIFKGVSKDYVFR